MQPSPSSGSVPASSPSASELPEVWIVPLAHGFGAPPPPPPECVVVVPETGGGGGAAFGVVFVVVFVVVVFATGTAGCVTATPTPSSPFMPAAACPVTEQRNSYLPFLSVTVSVA